MVVGKPEILAPIAALSAYAGIIGTVLSAKWRRLRRGREPKWAELWKGKFGHTLARVAGANLGQRAVPEGRPTEMAIAMSAEALFTSFPKAIRESLGDVPAVLRALEARAHLARARITELDATVAQAQHAPRAGASDQRQEALVADLREARGKAETRLADVVTALENVRLDLLRLHAGAGTTEGITQDLAAARALGEDADRLLAGVREAEDALKPR
jgi:serine/threonine-protein kinase